MKENKESSSKQILLSVLGVAILVVAVVGVSFAAFSYSRTGEKVNQITTGTITMNYSDVTNGINISNAMPMTDANGKSLSDENQYFDFKVSATIAGDATINYAITATKEADTTLPDTGVKLYLTSANGATADSKVELDATKISALTKTVADNAAGAPVDQFILKSGTITADEETTYRLRMWVASDYSGTNGSLDAETYKLRVNVYGAASAQ